MNEFIETQVTLRWAEPKTSYDVVIIGGGGHGLSTAYHLATRHGITDVAVIERHYIGSGNTGRNTTIIRSNYGIAESVRFYQRSVELYAQLEAETGRWLMHTPMPILWLAHSEAHLRNETARVAINQAHGADTVNLTAAEAKRICPQLDLTGGGEYPILGGSLHRGSATARHDRVAYALAEGAMRAGVDVVQRTTVTGLQMEGGRVTGVHTDKGPINAGTVVSAVGGRVSTIAAMAGLRLPIRTHPLQAFVTSHYAHCLDAIVSSADLGVYVSQTPRGEMLLGAGIDQFPSYSQGSGFDFLQETAGRALVLLPFLRNMRVLRQWGGICDMTPDTSPIMGFTGVDGFLVTTGWGTWGFKAIPVAGEQMAELIATGRTPELIRPFSLDRFAGDRLLADAGSAGTAH